MLPKLLSITCATCILVSSTKETNQISKFAGRNNLWKQDNLEEISNIDHELFNKIIDIAIEMYKPIADQNGDVITVNRNWSDSSVDAECMHYEGTVIINLFGGLARRPEITPDGFAMILCHELGHVYGGQPYTSARQEMSAEGQADYYSAQTCINKMLPNITDTASKTITPYIAKTCSDNYGSGTPQYASCTRKLLASNGLGKLLAVIKKEHAPNFETPDLTMASNTIISYPTVQCRLDTYMRGSLDLARPACWYKESSFAQIIEDK